MALVPVTPAFSPFVVHLYGGTSDQTLSDEYQTLAHEYQTLSDEYRRLAHDSPPAQLSETFRIVMTEKLMVSGFKKM